VVFTAVAFDAYAYRVIASPDAAEAGAARRVDREQPFQDRLGR